MRTAPPCKQVDRTNQPHTQPHRNNSQSMHAFIHSFNATYSLYHSFTRTNHAPPLPFITIIIHQPCNARTTKYAFVEARMTLPWLARNGMHLHAYRLPITSQRYMHRDDNFLPPTECADEHLRWWWWYWPQSTRSSLLDVESWFMNDRPEGNGHENMCDDR